MLLDTKLLDAFVSFMAVDQMNPLNREATVVFIRYVSDSNDRVKQYIDSLHVVDLDSDENKVFSKTQFI